MHFFFLGKRQIKFGSLKVFFLLPPNKRRNKENAKKKTFFERFKTRCRRNAGFVACWSVDIHFWACVCFVFFFAWEPPKFWCTRRVLTATSRRTKAFAWHPYRDDWRGSYSCQPLLFFLKTSMVNLPSLYPTDKILICGLKNFLKFFQEIYKEAT